MEPRTYREAAEDARRFYIGTNCHVACIDAATGETLWQVPIHQSVAATLVTLLHYKDLLFAACLGSAARLGLDGLIHWQTKVAGLGEPVSLALDPGVPGGQLLLGASGKLFALSAEDGGLLWTNELPGLGYHPICLRAPGLITANAVQRRHGKTLQLVENEQSEG